MNSIWRGSRMLVLLALAFFVVETLGGTSSAQACQPFSGASEEECVGGVITLGGPCRGTYSGFGRFKFNRPKKNEILGFIAINTTTTRKAGGPKLHQTVVTKAAGTGCNAPASTFANCTFEFAIESDTAQTPLLYLNIDALNAAIEARVVGVDNAFWVAYRMKCSAQGGEFGHAGDTIAVDVKIGIEDQLGNCKQVDPPDVKPFMIVMGPTAPCP